MRWTVLLTLAMLAGLSLTRAATAGDLTVFAAASLQGPLEEATAGSGLELTIAYGGSATLARQIADGAPADVVILASSDWMDWLAERGLIEAGSRVDILGNSLVLIGPAGAAPVELSAAGLTAALGEGRLAIGLTASVPAGVYGRAALETLGLWGGVAGRLAEAENVRAALAMVERGEMPLGLVYRSDALSGAAVSIVAGIPREATPPIRYPAAVVAGAGSADAAALVDYLAGPQAQAIFAAAGFSPPPPEGADGG